ncbi:hypothetical protein [Paracoccus sulfuroxidans]|uniref:Uncharacterized protein n=1 Tax=Paracoccus sulfuroxidans TaxID=384678 RepID=A0A562P1M3_9RHOB|nr:hypothetical protein [Paracoccus sulfuroxidans]TWI38241.1 hypothetical protein IQ24_00379 [Paracoccus sulfuroxidans]
MRYNTQDIAAFADEVEDGLWDARLMGASDARLAASSDFQSFLNRRKPAEKITEDLIRGSEKQVKWAKDIRNEFVAKFGKTHEAGVKRALNTEMDARIWIDARSKLETLAVKFQRQAEAEEEKREAKAIIETFKSEFSGSHPNAVQAAHVVKNKSWIKNASKLAKFADKIEERALETIRTTDTFNAYVAERGGRIVVDDEFIAIRQAMEQANKRLLAS